MRNAFIDELVMLAKARSNIALIVGDLGYSVIEPFADQFPDRFINAGVAEQNMTGIAAGMASEGFHVFTYSIANFPTYRCAEQIRNDVDYHRLPVTVVAVGGGLSYGALGYSHHAIQDYALMRSMPNMLIAAPGDPMETRACLRYLVDHPQPSYLRLGKAGEPVFHATVPDIAPGRWVRVAKEGNGQAEHALLSTGAALRVALAAAKQSGDACDVYSLPLWGSSCKAVQAEQLAGYQGVTTFEDHLYDAGFGSWLMESVVGKPNLLGIIRNKALDPIVCGTTGSQKTLELYGGLTA
ncbi:transketolase family protein [Chitinibacteraceae bacterium HSL-7]